MRENRTSRNQQIFVPHECHTHTRVKCDERARIVAPHHRHANHLSSSLPRVWFVIGRNGFSLFCRKKRFFVCEKLTSVTKLHKISGRIYTHQLLRERLSTKNSNIFYGFTDEVRKNTNGGCVNSKPMLFSSRFFLRTQDYTKIIIVVNRNLSECKKHVTLKAD